MSNLNLLPDYYVKERFRYRVDMICVVLFAIVMAALIVVGKRTESDLNAVQNEHASVAGQFDEAADFVERFFALQGERDALRKDLAALEKMRQPVGYTYILGTVTAACPDDVDLKNIFIHEGDTGSSRGANLSGAKAPKEPEYLKVVMNGYAESEESIGQLVGGIKQDALMRNVSWPFTTVIERQGQIYREFNINFEVRTDRKAIAEVRKSREATSNVQDQDADAGTEEAS